ncbi:PREDICTED: growth arrest and DNA damage-inducible proteins-interacting protein 1 [Papilio polytes]|uniref:growth arrest and DNA damage-inducible proteins-interacting protein 1 n=1 Tax=Papilio polytes TaxID=76194 RepID=UPI00067657F0|nr:PREDICTED: growth arrest and DNA damage-inducible proteins-interacting protein 1 [Papilio polytes]
MNLPIRSNFIRCNLLASLRKYATTSPEIEQNEQVLIDDTDDVQAREAEIEKKRNKSKLSPAHYNLVNGRRPYVTPKSTAHLTVKYNRKMYGIYGVTSGVNPSLCWPTKAEIQEKQEYEAVAYPFTIREMIDAAAVRRKEEQARIEERDKEVAAKFHKLDQWKKELNAKIAKKTAEVQAAKLKKERLVEEVRRHFGFTLDPRDERFQEMLAKREKEQKKKEKQARMEAKEKLMIAKLQQKNVELNEKA